jgi:hypothetical protein
VTATTTPTDLSPRDLDCDRCDCEIGEHEPVVAGPGDPVFDYATAPEVGSGPLIPRGECVSRGIMWVLSDDGDVDEVLCDCPGYVARRGPAHAGTRPRLREQDREIHPISTRT